VNLGEGRGENYKTCVFIFVDFNLGDEKKESEKIKQGFQGSLVTTIGLVQKMCVCVLFLYALFEWVGREGKGGWGLGKFCFLW
jgi:hypothetical protein